MTDDFFLSSAIILLIHPMALPVLRYGRTDVSVLSTAVILLTSLNKVPTCLRDGKTDASVHCTHPFNSSLNKALPVLSYSRTNDLSSPLLYTNLP